MLFSRVILKEMISNLRYIKINKSIHMGKILQKKLRENDKLRKDGRQNKKLISLIYKKLGLINLYGYKPTRKMGEMHEQVIRKNTL